MLILDEIVCKVEKPNICTCRKLLHAKSTPKCVPYDKS